MVSKEKFVEIINRLKEADEVVNKVNDILRNTRENIENDFMNASAMSISHEGVVVELLKIIFNDEDDWISWWIYEEDYGRKFKVGDVSYKNEEGIEIYPNLTNAEGLYDFLKGG